MEIFYNSQQMKKICSSDKKMVRKLGSEMAVVLKLRLNELEAVENLDDMKFLPAARCHELTQNRKGQISADLIHPQRLIFKPHHDPMPKKPDGGLDWTLVTRILIWEITDPHPKGR